MSDVETRIDLMRDKAALFPSLKGKEHVQSMRIWYCKYKTLRSIGEYSNLRELIIAAFPDRELEILAPLTKLRHL